MADLSLRTELATIAVEEARRLGATAADARFDVVESAVDHADLTEGRSSRIESVRGLGLRVDWHGVSGFAAASEPNRHDAAVLAQRAVAEARAAAVVGARAPRPEPTTEPRRGILMPPEGSDPLSVPPAERSALLADVLDALRGAEGCQTASAEIRVSRRERLVLTSDGTEVVRTHHALGIHSEVSAAGTHGLARRSFPMPGRLAWTGAGWSAVAALEWVAAAERSAKEAALLSNTPVTWASDAPVLLLPWAAAEPTLALAEAYAGGRSRGLRGTPRLCVVPALADGVGRAEIDDLGLPTEAEAMAPGGPRPRRARLAANYDDPPRPGFTNLVLGEEDGPTAEALLSSLKSGYVLPTLSVCDRQVLRAEVAYRVVDGETEETLIRPPPLVWRGARGFWGACRAVGRPSEAPWGIADGDSGPVGLRLGPVQLAGLAVLGVSPERAEPGADR